LLRGDLNRDGRNDIFAAWCSSGAEQCGAVSLLNSPGAEGGIRFTSQSVSLGVDRAANWILQDVNHDGKPDLLFLNRRSGVAVHYGAPAEIVVALGLGNGKFAPPRSFSAPTSNSLGMVLADFDHDGQADLAVLDAAPAEGGESECFWDGKVANSTRQNR
jgi:FG-GAP-like repeat